MKLDYTDQWLALGIISNDDINIQLQEQEKIDDFNNEHMRYKSLVRFYRNAKITHENIYHVIRLLDSDHDQSMVIGFYIFLIYDKELPDIIFEIICDKLGKISMDYIDQCNRARIMRECYKMNDLSFSTVEKFINDEKYHRLLVDSSNDKVTLLRIDKLSTSKKIKNIINSKIKELERKAKS